MTHLSKLIIASFLIALSTMLLQAAPAALQLASNGKALCSIVVQPKADSLEQVAANELQAYLKKITGAQFAISNPLTKMLPPLKPIWIGKPASSGNDSEYNIVSLEDGLHLYGATPWKTLETVYIFLEQYAGCHFLAPWAEIVPENANLKVSAEYHYSPFVKTRTVHSKLFFTNPLFAAKRHVSTVTFPGFVPWAGVHTFNKLVPAEKWLSTHPEYFALVNGRRQPTQLCLSNDTVYQLVLDSVKAWFARSPQSTALSVSQDDNTSWCHCERCSATDAYEGSPAGTMIHFVNRVAANFPTKTISTLAYQYTRKAPLHVKPAKNVLVTLCSIECDRSAPIAEKCKDFEHDLIEWGKTGATVKIWDYTTQFTNFLAPFPNLHTLQPNVQLFANNNARWIFEQHSHNPSELFELRSYLLAQLLWNPQASYDSLYKNFMKLYYAKAAPFAEKYIDTVHTAMRSQQNFMLYLYGDPAQGFNSWLSEDRLKQYNQWYDAAEKAAGNDTALVSRVRAARMSVDYAVLEYSRRSSGFYSLANKQATQQTLNRFEASTKWINAVLINEMGLLTSNYIAGYKQLLQNANQNNLAAGKPVKLLTKPKKYAKEDPQTLTDGVFGGWSFYANWLGFEGNDLEAAIDLGETKSFSSLSMHFLQVVNHIVFFPEAVTFLVSNDGSNFTEVETVANKLPLTKQSRVNDIQLFATAPKALQARYIKVIGRSMKKAPMWHYGSGNPSWIFADELIVTK
jgi:hypothetical protein